MISLTIAEGVCSSCKVREAAHGTFDLSVLAAAIVEELRRCAPRAEAAAARQARGQELTSMAVHRLRSHYLFHTSLANA